MGFVQAFRGVRFTPQAGELKDLMAPPYDVISDQFREELYQRSPYNIVRISKSSEIEKEAPEAHYTQAAKNWAQWREEGATAQDDKPSYYFYEQEFQIQGQTYQRLGLICAHKLVEFGQGVLPHEKTLSGPKVDRHRLLTQTKTHFGQIFSLYSDQDGSVDQTLRKIYDSCELISEAKDHDQVIHRLKRTDNPEHVKTITTLFDGKEMIIADGHHRYETALKYSKEKNTLESSYLMMTVVSLSNPGLLVLPTHRLIKNLDSWNVDELLKQLEGNFEIQRMTCTSENKNEVKEQLLAEMKKNFDNQRSALGLYSGNGEFVLLVKKENAKVNVEASETFKNLDVVTLHQLVLEDHLGIDQEKLAQQTNVEYIKDSGTAIDESIAKVDSETHQAVFLMNPTLLQEIEDVAKSGEKMPQKSTFFHPKVFTGLVTYSVEPGVVNK